MIAAEIRDRKARIEALQQRWRKLQTTFYQMLAERGAQLAHIPGGSTGLLVCEYKGKGKLPVYHVDRAIISLSAELRHLERQAAKEMGQWGQKAPRTTLSPS
jgi:hypothetical protein